LNVTDVTTGMKDYQNKMVGTRRKDGRSANLKNPV